MCKTKSFGLKKSSKFYQNIFQPYWRETIRIASQTVWVCFGCKTELFGLVINFAYCGLAPVVSGPEKVVNIRLKHFSAVTGKDKNCILTSMGMFRVQKRVIWAWFSTLLAPVVSRRKKVVKIRLKYFLVVFTWNDKNCTSNNVSMFRV